MPLQYKEKTVVVKIYYANNTRASLLSHTFLKRTLHMYIQIARDEQWVTNKT